MFDLIWETSAASAAQLRISLREANVPSQKWQIWRDLNVFFSCYKMIWTFHFNLNDAIV